MFLQKRGKHMALTNLAVYGGSFCTPVLLGKITYTIGRQWTFYFVAIFSGARLPLVFSQETSYPRSTHLNIDMASLDDIGTHHKQIGPGYE
jgi:MFS family permease